MGQELLGEILGTAILILLGDGVVANVSLDESKGKDAGWLTITLGWGLAVAIAAYISGYLSPAHLNPAVSFAFAMTGDLAWSALPGYILAQMAGAILGAILVWLTYRPHYQLSQDPATILGTFATAPAIKSPVDNLFAEAMGTFMLVFGIMSFGFTEMAPGLATAVIGGLIVSIGVSLGGPTGYAINPARDLGPRLAHAFLPIKHKGDSDWSYAWVPVLGPFIGASLAALVYGLVNS